MREYTPLISLKKIWDFEEFARITHPSLVPRVGFIETSIGRVDFSDDGNKILWYRENERCLYVIDIERNKTIQRICENADVNVITKLESGQYFVSFYNELGYLLSPDEFEIEQVIDLYRQQEPVKFAIVPKLSPFSQRILFKVVNLDNDVVIVPPYNKWKQHKLPGGFLLTLRHIEHDNDKLVFFDRHGNLRWYISSYYRLLTQFDGNKPIATKKDKRYIISTDRLAFANKYIIAASVNFVKNRRDEVIGYNHDIVIIDSETGEIENKIDVGKWINDIKILNGRYLLVAAEEPYIRIYDIKNLPEIEYVDKIQGPEAFPLQIHVVNNKIAAVYGHNSKSKADKRTLVIYNAQNVYDIESKEYKWTGYWNYYQHIYVPFKDLPQLIVTGKNPPAYKDLSFNVMIDIELDGKVLWDDEEVYKCYGYSRNDLMLSNYIRSFGSVEASRNNRIFSTLPKLGVYELHSSHPILSLILNSMKKDMNIGPKKSKIDTNISINTNIQLIA